MKKTLFILFFILSSLNLWSQSSTIATLFQSNERKAELQYNHLAYRNALELYLIVYEKDPSNLLAEKRIADCYYKLGDMNNAEKWYAQLVAPPDHDPELEYQFAQVLSIQGKYGDAEKWFQQYYKQHAEDKRAKEKYEFMYLISYYYRDSTLYEINNLDLNSDQSDFAPQYYNGGIAFVSARDWNFLVKRQSTSAINDKEQMLNIFHTTDSTSNVSLFYHKDINSNFHDGPISFYDDNRKVAFTRSNLNNGKPVHHSGKVKLKLFFGQLNESGELSQIESFPFNDDSYSIGHPSLNNEGSVLYFSSDMPGGYGGADIYKSTNKGGKWTQPENIGPKVNTLGDEFFPHLVSDSILYFSSNGHGGLGGLDLYYSISNEGSFKKPENLGFPLNSSMDDFSLIFNSSGREGLFASNRPGGKGYDDVYSFTTNKFFLVGKVVEHSDTTQGISEVKIKWKVKGTDTYSSITSNELGYFHADLDFDRDYTFGAEKEGYTSIDTLSYSTHIRYTGRDSIELTLWKHALFAKGIIYSNETQTAMKDAVVILHNLKDGTKDSVRTDQDGKYELLVLPESRYTVKARKPGFIDDGLV